MGAGASNRTAYLELVLLLVGLVLSIHVGQALPRAGRILLLAAGLAFGRGRLATFGHFAEVSGTSWSCVVGVMLVCGVDGVGSSLCRTGRGNWVWEVFVVPCPREICQLLFGPESYPSLGNCTLNVGLMCA